MKGIINVSPSSSPPDFSPLAIDADLAPLPEYKAAGETKIDFGGLLPATAPLRLHEDLSSGCGGQLWPAGMVLATHMLRDRRSSIGRERILELGAGGGLVSLAVARGCDIETPMLITDQLEMLALMEHNIRLNEVEDKAKALILNWYVLVVVPLDLSVIAPEEKLGEPLPQQVIDLKPTVVLAADCVYFEPAFPLLLQTLTDLLALSPPKECTVYFCFKKRRRADMQFLKKAQKMFSVVEVPDQDRPVFSRQNLFLYAITSKEEATRVTTS
ncbi:hypothetical protein PpBr36_00859 [Pyricularia pennisetigena]|uniref:hypothetical protein n=1 Tax=Pyricularia pennisetigena TaxID=1578925 RepID=UPI00115407CC|nr:hypothetical protein PpBr36_00859 [Pyricularia pennisetigena]TLS29680.1 hypothetical protein PpBr36_00859 [Pyricularia pennisetigena]